MIVRLFGGISRQIKDNQKSIQLYNNTDYEWLKTISFPNLFFSFYFGFFTAGSFATDFNIPQLYCLINYTDKTLPLSYAQACPPGPFSLKEEPDDISDRHTRGIKLP